MREMALPARSHLELGFLPAPFRHSRLVKLGLSAATLGLFFLTRRRSPKRRPPAKRVPFFYRATAPVVSRAIAMTTRRAVLNGDKSGSVDAWAAYYRKHPDELAMASKYVRKYLDAGDYAGLARYLEPYVRVEADAAARAVEQRVTAAMAAEATRSTDEQREGALA